MAIIKEENKLVSLGIPANTIEIIKKYNFNFRKQFGQNFLIDTGVLDRIVEAAALTKEDCLLEIGPGIGTLTRYLSEKAGKVVAVEIDKNLIPILNDTLSDCGNVEIINDDILKVDIARLAMEHNNGRPMKVVANLPYYITTPIVMELLEGEAPISSITIMVQKEVADRMCTGPGSKDYGALSLAVGYYSMPEIVTYAPPNCFIPRPKVGSTVIKLTRHKQPPVEVDNPSLMFGLIRASFNQRRKTLTNGILSGQAQGIVKFQEGYRVDREELEDIFAELGWSASVRGETLTLEQWAALSNVLTERNKI